MDSAAHTLPKRDFGSSLATFLQNPYQAQLVSESIWASIGTSIGFTLLLAIGFSLLRPYNSVVYAPKLKHADERHAPPPMGRGLFAWVGPVVKTTEQDLIVQIGLDATVFLRFTRMCRNIFTVLSVIGCAILLPTYLIGGRSFYSKYQNVTLFAKLTPQFIWGQSNSTQCAVAWLFDITICGFLWWNYRAVLRLRRQYFESAEYHQGLHARTLMINNIPKSFSSDEGISKLIDKVVPTSSFSRTAIARNVKELPELIDAHEKTVRKLEKHLAHYLKNPDQLPSVRPVCDPSKKDPAFGSYTKGQKVDAIDYLTGRIRDLEQEIKDIRNTIDRRNPLPYGFASFEDIEEAHSIAYAARDKHPEGTRIVLAPKPNDIIWGNMPLSKRQVRIRRLTNNLWYFLLTIVWIAPNAFISIFLVNLGNLGDVWPAFQTSLSGHTTWWAIVQGVASPAITSIVFLVLPIIFRRMSMKAGDRTKTSRERHVTTKLYTFFVFNNLLVFSIFSTLSKFITQVVKDTQDGTGAWDAIKNYDLASGLFLALCTIAPFWVTFLLQRNLGAAIDLAQIWSLFWSFCLRRFSSLTPREMIELTAPPTFDYASYYNYFLYYTTVALCYSTIMPIVLPAAALYFAIDVYLKKYLLLYVFVTKTESGGMFWRILFNRVIFAIILSNLITFLAVYVQGDGQHMEAYSIVPLPFLVLAFKFFCAKSYDKKIQYLTVVHRPKDVEAGFNPMAMKHQTKNDRLASRFGHPALYRPLITPMVHGKAQNILASIYRGRLTDPNSIETSDMTSTSGYSDTYVMDHMNSVKPGKRKKSQVPGFEIVPESQLDFTYYKNRAEFGQEHGAGEIYGRPEDLISERSRTPGTAYSTPPESPREGSQTPTYRSVSAGPEEGQSYPAGYIPARAYDGIRDGPSNSRRMYNHDNDSGHVGLVSGAAHMPSGSGYRRPSESSEAPPGFLGGGPQGYGGLPQFAEEEEHERRDPLTYDYFRGPRSNGGDP